MVDDHTAWVKGSVPPPLDQRKFLPLTSSLLVCNAVNFKTATNVKFQIMSLVFFMSNYLWLFYSSTLFTTRCKVWCGKWRLLPHCVLQWLLEPSEGLLSHQRDTDEAAAAPHLLPAVPVALAAVCRAECSLTVELPARGHVRAVWWRSRLSQGKRSRVTENLSRCEAMREYSGLDPHIYIRAAVD